MPPVKEIQPEELVFLNCFMHTFNRPYSAYLAGYVPEIPRGKEITELTSDEKFRLSRAANRLINRKIIKAKLNEMIEEYFYNNRTFDLNRLLENLTNIIMKCQMNEYRNHHEVKNSIEATKILLIGFPNYGQDRTADEKIHMFRNSEDVIRFEKMAKRASLKEGGK